MINLRDRKKQVVKILDRTHRENILELIAEIERLQAEQDEVKGRLSALIQVCELIQPFIGKKYVVTEIKTAVELAKGSPTIYQQKPEEWKEGRREEYWRWAEIRLTKEAVNAGRSVKR